MESLVECGKNTTAGGSAHLTWAACGANNLKVLETGRLTCDISHSSDLSHSGTSSGMSSMRSRSIFVFGGDECKVKAGFAFHGVRNITV